jgi:2'-hydroxyisoflavone reductase
MKRRQFLKKMATSATLLGLSPWLACSPAEKGLNILVLGGTNFVGPAIVNAGLKNGHKITLFNRGITNPGLFPDLPLIKGDREKGAPAYEPLKGHQWDVVIDVWPEKSYLVDDATSALQDHTGYYVFISSIAVYRDFQEVGLHEGSEVKQPGPDPANWSYGEEKIAAEGLTADRFPQKHTILRPGPIKGWRDPALDLLYWLVKLKRNESILAPGSRKDPLQFIDVKDVGRFAIHAVENQLAGIYNCTGPGADELLWEEFLDIAKNHLGSTSELYWPSEDFLRENQVRSFKDLPLWAPLSEVRGFMRISKEKAIDAGFQYTPIQQTIDDCLRWFEEQMEEDFKFGVGASPVGLERSRELQLIEML